MRFFLAGIIQGSEKGKGIHAQDYRRRIREVIEAHVPGADVYCPVENHPESVEYSDEEGKRVFLHHVDLAAGCDVLVAYLPEASLGTGVEMWECYRRGTVVVTVSPMTHNWTVKFLSDAVYPDVESFERAAASGELAGAIEAARRCRRREPRAS